MTQTTHWTKFVLAAFLVFAVAGFVSHARAADLPLAAASPLTGVAFDDRPLLLPVQRNFQMAMLTAGSELGRSCGHMEAYGWRMSQTEQGRVNQIFNNTVDRLRLLGYTIAPQTLSSVSKDITLFTADRSDKHFIFLWSAGELGLVLNLCETSAPLTPTGQHASPTSLVPSVQVFPVPADNITSSKLDVPGKTRMPVGAFSPVGEWVGSYICAQGYTGGTLQIGQLHGEDFDGVFKFYPTAKNPGVAEGSYTVYGQYDKETNRILINPGKWIKRPSNFYNTVMVGSFDPSTDAFSAYFQGISGCTSFEAHREGAAWVLPRAVKGHKTAKKSVKKKVVKKKPVKKPVTKPVPAKPVETAPETSAPLASPPTPEALPASNSSAAPTTAPTAAVPAIAAPAAPAPVTTPPLPAVPAPAPANSAPAAPPPAPVAPVIPQAPAQPQSLATPPSPVASSAPDGIVLAAPPPK